MSSALKCKCLVLDAGPLLSLSPLRGLAEKYVTVPQVLEELKDKRAREHFERLGLSAGVHVEVRSPDAASLAHVVQFAKKTGDYSVLSHADLCVIAVTYALQKEADDLAQLAKATENAASQAQAVSEKDIFEAESVAVSSTLADLTIESGGEGRANTSEDSSPDVEPVDDTSGHNDSAVDEPSTSQRSSSSSPDSDLPKSLYDDPSDEDDGEGDWITPQNVALHKSRALDLLPDASSGKKASQKPVDVGCMSADFAMQNVLLQMDLKLVGTEGKRIEKVKSWVLRCHACFKICKDNTKKFCPSCGNPTLLRASVTIAAPGASADAPAMQVHLKPNYQYRLRGTKYSIPAPKSGSAKKGPGEGLILREDQTEYIRAKKRADGKREREEQRMVKGLIAKGGEGGVSVGSWMDPDWIPEIIGVGAGGKGRSQRMGNRDGDMPVIGYGRKNPNERKRKK